MCYKNLSLLLLAFLSFGVSLQAESETAPLKPPFRVGEVLEYDLRWSAVHVGYATLTVHEMDEIDGETAWHFSFEVRTNNFADAFFKVRTRIDSWVAEDLTRTLFYREKKREGKTRRDIEITFDWDKREAVYTNFGEAEEPIELPEGPLLDSVGAVYYFRSLPLALLRSYPFHVTDGKKVVGLSLTIEGWDWIEVPAGRFNAYRIEPQTGELGGVFEKSEDSDLLIWFSRDRLIYPVQVQGEVAVGSFWAKLKDIHIEPQSDEADTGSSR